MSRTLKDFLADFNSLTHLHSMYIDSDVATTPEQIRDIVNGAMNGEKNSLEKIPMVKKYFETYADMIDYQLKDRRNWEYYYPDPEPDDPDPDFNPYTADVEKLEIMKRLLSDLNKSPQELFGVMKPEEMMALTSMTRQMPIQFPTDIKRYTGEFVGKTPKGGSKSNGGSKRKTKRNKKRNKRRKTINRRSKKH